MEIFYTPHFKREAKALPVRLRGQIEKRIMLFQNDPFDPVLKTHKLSGGLSEFWSFSIDHRIRIIFEFERETRVIFHSIGNHSIYD